MSAPRYRIPAKLRALLHARGLTVEELAQAILSGRSHVNQVLANKPGRGHRTRTKLASCLRPDELAVLGWDAHGRLLSFPVERLKQTEQTKQTTNHHDQNQQLHPNAGAN